MCLTLSNGIWRAESNVVGRYETVPLGENIGATGGRCLSVDVDFLASIDDGTTGISTKTRIFLYSKPRN